jgi:hypothetical protein
MRWLTNTDAAMNILQFLRGRITRDCCTSQHVMWRGNATDGCTEKLIPNYTPHHVANFDAEQEWRSLHEVIAKAEAQAEGAEVTAGLRVAVAGEGACGERAAGGGTGESDPQESDPVAKDVFDRRREHGGRRNWAGRILTR